MRSAKIITYLCLVVLCLSGCSILSNMDQITTLSSYSREKDAQHHLVKSINDHYDALAKVIEQGHISDYKDEASFTHSFGDPILKKDMNDGTQRWLYRYAIYRYAKSEVNVYFDQGGTMVKWEKSSCPSLF